MRTFLTALTAATVVGTALAAPASAQMRTSAPQPAAAAGMTETGIRPTSIGGVERAQSLTPGATIWSASTTRGIGLNYGLAPNLELGVDAFWNPGLEIAPEFSLTGGLDANLGAKYLLLPGDSVSVAVTGEIDIDVNRGGANTTNTAFLIGLPISFWLGQGAFHVGPHIAISGGGNAVGATLAYERQINSQWRWYVTDALRATDKNEILNALTGGVRVAATPNLTVDVGLATGNLDINRIDPSDTTKRQFGLGVGATLFNFTVYYGTGAGDEMRRFFGF